MTTRSVPAGNCVSACHSIAGSRPETSFNARAMSRSRLMPGKTITADFMSSFRLSTAVRAEFRPRPAQDQIAIEKLQRLPRAAHQFSIRRDGTDHDVAFVVECDGRRGVRRMIRPNYGEDAAAPLHRADRHPVAFAEAGKLRAEQRDVADAVEFGVVID